MQLAKTGRSVTLLAASTAQRASAMSVIVSMKIASGASAARAAACSANAAKTSSNVAVPSGSITSPVGPMSASTCGAP